MPPVIRRRAVRIVALAALAAPAPVASAHMSTKHQITSAAPVAAPTVDAILQSVRDVHGAAGPWAVAGYRIGQRALREFDLPAKSFDLVVTHRTPAEVQFSCIADGVQAATGASPGKLTLKMETVPVAALATEAADKRSGRRLLFRLQPALMARMKDLPYEQLETGGREVAQLPDAQIFTMEELPREAPAGH